MSVLALPMPAAQRARFFLPTPACRGGCSGPCGIRQGPSPPLRRTPQGQHAALLSSLVLTTFFHKSPVHTSHFWIAGFPLRIQTISL